ncbi:hypothetical protein LCGC14_1796290, partial [marine sediment metagenome]
FTHAFILTFMVVFLLLLLTLLSFHAILTIDSQ